MRSWRAVLLLAALTLFFGVSFTQVSWADTAGNGWVRLANLSETLSPADFSIVSSSGTVIVEGADLSYGGVLTPQTLPAGTYTVDVRKHGASPVSAPAASAKITVAAGRFYTVGPVEVAGSGSQQKLVDLPDAATTPSGDASVQAIDAAYQHGNVTFNGVRGATTGTILTKAAGGTANSADMAAGTWTMTATASDGKTATTSVAVSANGTQTEIVLDTTSGLQVLSLMDTAGDAPAMGSVTTGLAPVSPGPGSPLPWVALIGAGGLLAAVGGVRLARGGLRRPAIRE